MSEPFSQMEDYIRSLPHATVQVALAQGAHGDDVSVRADVEASEGGRELAEGSIRAVPIGESQHGRLVYFLDGMQRPRGPIYINGSVPIVYGYVAAAIRKRGTDKRMRTLRTSELYHTPDEAFYFDEKLLKRDGLSIVGPPTVNTRDDGKPFIEHPLALLQAAHDKIGTVRGKCEQRLTARWVSEFCGGEDWLLVDGGLGVDYSKPKPANIVGVTKSHGTQYLTWEEQQHVFGLRVGERSTAFVPYVKDRSDPSRKKANPVYSWYLRMYPSESQDVYFGLVRVEVPKTADTLAMANEVSRWILAERCPLSLPDARWDRMIYPIRDCEQYMKSLAPSHASLDAKLFRLAAIARKRSSEATAVAATGE